MGAGKVNLKTEMECGQICKFLNLRAEFVQVFVYACTFL